MLKQGNRSGEASAPASNGWRVCGSGGIAVKDQPGRARSVHQGNCRGSGSQGVRSSKGSQGVAGEKGEKVKSEFLTVGRIRAHLDMMRSHGQHEYAEAARRWYWELLGQYLK